MVLTSLILAQPATADCRCVANGARYVEGEQACLKMPDGPRLARCEKVLNNSSWKMLGRDCSAISMQDSDPPVLAAR
ncbi:hypothetical protein [Nitratireductor thuwali]|uniref:DUF333 domain-containing protein n=1 Tax=Nitratireductor thuwali TaxID=2267699 RepID=A0ABY5MPE3_9HYPH|nr:hypothetical protein NTH_03806 [Nitratireductor thuwali]